MFFTLFGPYPISCTSSELCHFLKAIKFHFLNLVRASNGLAGSVRKKPDNNRVSGLYIVKYIIMHQSGLAPPLPLPHPEWGLKIMQKTKVVEELILARCITSTQERFWAKKHIVKDFINALRSIN